MGFSQRAGVADRRPGQFAGAPERGAVTGDDLGDGPHPYRRGLGETNQVRSEVAAEVDTGHGERRRDGQHDLGSAERSGGRVDLNHLADEPDPGDRGRQPQRCLREPGGQTGGQRVGAGLEPVGRCVDRVAGDPPYPGAVLHDRVTGPVLFERGDTELRDELGDPLVAVPEPGGAQVVPVDARQPAADAVACLHADDVEPGGPQRGGRGQPGRAGADNDDVVARSEGWHGRLLSEPESHAVGVVGTIRKRASPACWALSPCPAPCSGSVWTRGRAPVVTVHRTACSMAVVLPVRWPVMLRECMTRSAIGSRTAVASNPATVGRLCGATPWTRPASTSPPTAVETINRAPPELAHRHAWFLGGGVNAVVSARIQGRLPLLLAAADGDGLTVHRRGAPHREMAQPTDADHGDPVAGLRAAVPQCVEGGDPGTAERRGLGRRQLARDPSQGSGRHGDRGRPAAGIRQARHPAIRAMHDVARTAGGGRDHLWYAYESEPGHDDWWPRGTPDLDPVGALTGLGLPGDL